MAHRRPALTVVWGAAALLVVAAGGQFLRMRAESGPPGHALRFSDVTRTAGIRFRHTHGGCGERLFPEMFPSGCAFLDYDGDGYLDVYLVDGAPLPGCPGGSPHGARLYCNQGDGTFADVTAVAGVGNRRYGLGCCAGDYDNDGDLDLYVTNRGANCLYRNNGDGTFTDVAPRAGVTGGRFSTSAAFADYDSDGYLDLYVCNYATYRDGEDRGCRPIREVPTYCLPNAFGGQQDLLYHNNGDGTFTDVSRAAGIVVPEPGRGMGVVWSDFDADGDADLYVANDLNPNFLFRNNGDGTFREVGTAAGVALNKDGKIQAGMGVATADPDQDGDLDLFVTNFSNETNTFYRNEGGLRFVDATEEAGLGAVSLPFLAFGTAFFDADLDGRTDLYVANGHVWDDVGIWEQGIHYPQRDFLFLNAGRGRFREIGQECGAPFRSARVGRGTAIGDYDNDGDVDVLVSNSNQAPELLRNELPAGAHWIRFELTGTRCNRSAIGARVRIESGGRVQTDDVRSGSSYCSQHDLRLTFGLGRASRVERVTIRWPGGRLEHLENLAANRGYRLREGAGAQPVEGTARKHTAAGSAGAPTLLDMDGADPAPPTRRPDRAGMARIPAGSFAMGAADLDEDERPVHPVQVDAFYLDCREVTYAEFARFVQESGYRPQGNWRQGNPAGQGRLPVAGVTWADADAYCRWRGKRLPTEAEWERAARGREGFRYAYGERYDPARANADSRGARPVGSYAPNSFGLYDMSGNVAEWCADWYAVGYDAQPAGRNPIGPGEGDFRVVRGGSWSNYHFLPHPSRCDARAFLAPTFRSPTVGFRCAASASDVERGSDRAR